MMKINCGFLSKMMIIFLRTIIDVSTYFRVFVCVCVCVCVCVRSKSLAGQASPNQTGGQQVLDDQAGPNRGLAQTKQGGSTSLDDQAGPNSGPAQTAGRPGPTWEIAHMFSFHYTHLKKTITKHVSIFF